MNDEPRKLTQEEIDAQEGEGLPPREVMSVIQPSMDGVDPVWTLPVEGPLANSDETVA